MEQILTRHPKAGIIIAGDLNTMKVSSLCSGFHLKQIVKIPTRGDNILDKILTNFPSFYKEPVSAGKVGASDHDMILAIPTNVGLKTAHKVSVKYRPVNPTQKYDLANAVSAVNWNKLYTSGSCEEMYKFFETKISELINKHLPIKTKTIVPNEKPWITPAFRSLIAQRQRAKLSGNVETYKLIRNKVNKLSKSLKETFYLNSLGGLENGSIGNGGQISNN